MGRKAREKEAGRKSGKREDYSYLSPRPPPTYPFQNQDDSRLRREPATGLTGCKLADGTWLTKLIGKTAVARPREGPAWCSRIPPPGRQRAARRDPAAGASPAAPVPTGSRSRPRGGSSAAPARGPPPRRARPGRAPRRRRRVRRKVGFGVKGRHSTEPKVCSRRPPAPARRAHL